MKKLSVVNTLNRLIFCTATMALASSYTPGSTSSPQPYGQQNYDNTPPQATPPQQQPSNAPPPPAYYAPAPMQPATPIYPNYPPYPVYPGGYLVPGPVMPGEVEADEIFRRNQQTPR